MATTVVSKANKQAQREQYYSQVTCPPQYLKGRHYPRLCQQATLHIFWIQLGNTDTSPITSNDLLNRLSENFNPLNFADWALTSQLNLCTNT